MWLLIDRDQNSSTGWHGFDLIVNRTLGQLEINDGGWKWKDLAAVSYRVEGNQMQLALPMESFGARSGSTLKTFDFKWADNLQHPEDELDFHVSGDIAPDGRFRYRCTFE
jgi:hypothetical protein